MLADKRHIEGKELPRLVHQPTSTGAPRFIQMEDWSTLQRQAYGLIQVNRQIRKEFLPLYRERVAVRIDTRELPNYVAEVIQCTHTNPALIYRNISIDVRYNCSVDLQNVLLLHDGAPNLHLKFTHPGGDNDMMSILLDTHRWPEFHAYISERTRLVILDIGISDALVFCPGLVDDLDSNDNRDPPLLTWPYAYDSGYFAYVKGLLYVKEEFAEPWMYKSHSSSEHWRDGLANWEDRLGLGGSMRLRCSFRPQVQTKSAPSADQDSTGVQNLFAGDH